MSKLYVVATPIGNLGDITLRAKEVLGAVDFVACEDTRRTGILLGALGIKKPMISYYRHREAVRTAEIIQKMNEGFSVALVSDAGTPCISDPGCVLVRAARAQNLQVLAIPGASAASAAFSISGMHGGYVFLGFLPQKQKDRTAVVEEVKELKLALIFYSAPHDVKDDIDFLFKQLGNRKVSVFREMTKVFEECIEGNLGDIKISKQKGEFVIIVEGHDKQLAAKEISQTKSIKQEIEELIKNGMTDKDAIKTVAKGRGVIKDVVYKEWHDSLRAE